MRGRAAGGGATLAATVSIACAAGFFLGVRAIVTLGPTARPLLAADPVPRATLGIPWTAFAVWPEDARGTAVAALVGTVAALLFAVGVAAALNTVIILAEDSGSRRRELAVRSALGATPLALARALAGELRTRLLAGLSLGLVLGLSVGAGLRAAWPGTALPVVGGDTGGLPVDVALALVLLTLVLLGAHLSGVRRCAGGRALSDDLRSGGRTTSEPAEILLRRMLAAGHVAASGAILVSAAALASALDAAPGDAAAPEAGSPDAHVTTLSGSDGTDWAGVLAAAAAVPGIEAESLSAPGALLGLGIRDITITECGNCFRGLFPAPLWNSLADHHAVAGEYFALQELEVAEGRGFEATDTADSEPVVLVNRRLADTAFEDGEALGRRLRVGSGQGRWYRVVGVVEDHPVAGLGSEGRAREAVYLNLVQHDAGAARLLLRGSADAAEEVVRRLGAMGVTVAEPIPLAELRRAAQAPVAWAGWVARAAAGVVALIALFGIRVVARQTGRRQLRPLAIRRALGAPRRRLVSTVMSERLRTAAWGLAAYLLFGTLAAAFIERAAGAPPPPLGVWAAVGVLVFLASAGASFESVRVVPAAEPVTLLR